MQLQRFLLIVEEIHHESPVRTICIALNSAGVFLTLRGRGCSVVNTPYTPARFCALVVAGRMSIPGHASPPLAAVHGGVVIVMNTN